MNGESHSEDASRRYAVVRTASHTGVRWSGIGRYGKVQMLKAMRTVVIKLLGLSAETRDISEMFIKRESKWSPLRATVLVDGLDSSP